MKMIIALAAILATSTAALASWPDQIIDNIRSESKVVEAMFQNDGRTLWVSMRDDGSVRDGFARYLCLVLGDEPNPPTDFVIVHIWDAARMKDDLVEIGYSECRL